MSRTAQSDGHLSISMPVTGVEYGHRQVEPFLLGLLPDTDDAKMSIAKQVGGIGATQYRCCQEWD